jgi:hypothetical protein
VFAEARRDAGAASLVDRLAAEIVAYVRAAIGRLQLNDGRPAVLLGGGLIHAADGRLVEATRAGLERLGIDASVSAVTSPPIVGAALLGLDALGGHEAAYVRARAELEEAVARQIPGP